MSNTVYLSHEAADELPQTASSLGLGLLQCNCLSESFSEQEDAARKRPAAATVFEKMRPSLCFCGRVRTGYMKQYLLSSITLSIHASFPHPRRRDQRYSILSWCTTFFSRYSVSHTTASDRVVISRLRRNEVFCSA